MTALEEQAELLGKDHGRAVGSWVLDGNSTSETARAILRGYDDGDPEVMDMQPAPLSGEWADSWTPKTLADELGIAEDDERLDELCTEYELGYSTAYWDEVISTAKAYA